MNWHFTSRCNYHCTFCCTQNLSGNLNSLTTAIDVLTQLRRIGIEKINFVGGEPFTHPLIVDVLRLAKEAGFTTSVTTNGSLVTASMLENVEPYLDWIGISLDSPSESVEKKLGRGNGDHVRHAMELVSLIKKTTIKLKINTTVTKENLNDDMRLLISEIKPDRWKIFQFLHVKGQNDHAVASLSVTNEEFEMYKTHNSGNVLENGTFPVFENSYEMLDSYFMISPTGNVFINTEYPAKEIALECITKKSLPEILNVETYISRGAIYDW